MAGHADKDHTADIAPVERSHRKRNMKILHVITSLETGGAETLVVNLMPHFRALGHEVGVVVFKNGRTPLMERLEKECPDCKIYRLGTGYYHPKYIFQLIPIMRKYDVVHTHNSAPQLFATMANIFCHKKLVTTEHNTNNRKRGNWLMSRLDKWMYPRYQKVICISDQAEENLRMYLGLTPRSAMPLCSAKNPSLTPTPSPKGEGNMSLPNDNICTIYNGIDVKAFHEAAPIEELKSDRFVAVMVAGFRPQKDQDTLVKAMHLLPKDQYEVWMVGNGSRMESVRSLAESLKVQDSVKFLGLRTDVPNILKTADVVVMSTHYEGLSLSNIEGMAAGKPFVASDVEGIHEVTEGYGLLFPHEDAAALAGIIQQLHDDQAFYNQTARRCYERAKQFDISEMVRRYNEVYER